MATLRKIRRLNETTRDQLTWHMNYYNPAQRRKIRKAKKLAKRNRIFNNR